MAYRVVFTPEARAQLVSVYSYIAGEAGPTVALACRLLRGLHHISAPGHAARRSPARDTDDRLSPARHHGGQNVEDALRRDADE